MISIDGKPVDEEIAAITRLSKFANPSSTRRQAAQFLTLRPVSVLPRTVSLGETLEVEVEQAGGQTRRFTIPWIKEGFAPAKIGPVPSPRIAPATAAAAGRNRQDGEEDNPREMLLRAWNRNSRWKAPAAAKFARRDFLSERNGDEVDGWTLGWGARPPTFTLPTGFALRLGRSSADFHFSGTYLSAGKRIGYLRIPSFDPPSAAAAQRELAGEIAFFRQNTDGLVVDVQRNPGGGCHMLTAASYLIPRRFWFFGEEFRPTIGLISDFQSTLDLFKDFRAEQWELDTIEFQLGMIKTAYSENRGMTGPIPGCSLTFDNDPAFDSTGRTIAYEKPLIVLIDEFSTSAGDIFPAMMQDNKRGPLVGTRTTGAGGSVSLFNTGFFMEASATNTNSLVTRIEPRAVPGYPTSSYIENVGAHPDIPLERMTVENLRSNGREFVAEFTRIIVDEINKAAR